jgi:hypothetical protein
LGAAALGGSANKKTKKNGFTAVALPKLDTTMCDVHEPQSKAQPADPGPRWGPQSWRLKSD